MLAEGQLFVGRLLLLDLDAACLVHDADMADLGASRVDVQGHRKRRVLLLIYCCSVHLLIWRRWDINGHFIVGAAGLVDWIGYRGLLLLVEVRAVI